MFLPGRVQNSKFLAVEAPRHYRNHLGDCSAFRDIPFSVLNMANYTYPPPSKEYNEIRLVVLAPATSPAGEVRCDTEIVSPDEAPVYEALS